MWCHNHFHFRESAVLQLRMCAYACMCVGVRACVYIMYMNSSVGGVHVLAKNVAFASNFGGCVVVVRAYLRLLVARPCVGYVCGHMSARTYCSIINVCTSESADS